MKRVTRYVLSATVAGTITGATIGVAVFAMKKYDTKVLYKELKEKWGDIEKELANQVKGYNGESSQDYRNHLDSISAFEEQFRVYSNRFDGEKSKLAEVISKQVRPAIATIVPIRGVTSREIAAVSQEFAKIETTLSVSHKGESVQERAALIEKFREALNNIDAKFKPLLEREFDTIYRFLPTKTYDQLKSENGDIQAYYGTSEVGKDGLYDITIEGLKISIHSIQNKLTTIGGTIPSAPEIEKFNRFVDHLYSNVSFGLSLTDITNEFNSIHSFMTTVFQLASINMDLDINHTNDLFTNFFTKWTKFMDVDYTIIDGNTNLSTDNGFAKLNTAFQFEKNKYQFISYSLAINVEGVNDILQKYGIDPSKFFISVTNEKENSWIRSLSFEDRHSQALKDVKDNSRRIYWANGSNSMMAHINAGEKPIEIDDHGFDKYQIYSSTRIYVSPDERVSFNIVLDDQKDVLPFISSKDYEGESINDPEIMYENMISNQYNRTPISFKIDPSSEKLVEGNN